jgi:translation initiation factor 2 alpha subunit (eIF-2alpha)
MKYKLDDLILCRVKKIEGTTVFLETEDGFPGSMLLSEVAAGRIRNLRVYVSPNRKVVCKVLRVMPDHLELSLRRVTSKENMEVIERHKKERAFVKILKSIGEKESLIHKIKEESNIIEFLENAREDVKVLEKFFSKDKAEKLFGILAEKVGKEKVIEKKFVLMSDSEKGVEDIRDILDFKEVEIHYLGGGKFSVSVSGKDYKGAESKLDEVLEEIGKRAGEKKAKFEFEKGK